MELRHLRYFVAVAEAGSLTVAAEQTLHTTQPSLSRQIRDLEDEVGAQLFERSVQGIKLTPAGRNFLEHSRLILSQVSTALETTRRIATPAKPRFALGFLTGHEVDWLPEALRLLHGELPNVDVMISSQSSPQLASALSRGTIDAAIFRREQGFPELAFKLLVNEPLEVFMPSDHRLATRASIDPKDLVGETFLGISGTAPVLGAVVDGFLRDNDLSIVPSHQVDNLAMAMSLIASTRGVALMPAYGKNFVPWSVTSRPLRDKPPAIELVIGYKKSNPSPFLKLFLSRSEELVERVSKK